MHKYKCFLFITFCRNIVWYSFRMRKITKSIFPAQNITPFDLIYDLYRLETVGNSSGKISIFWNLKLSIIVVKSCVYFLEYLMILTGHLKDNALIINDVINLDAIFGLSISVEEVLYSYIFLFGTFRGKNRVFVT